MDTASTRPFSAFEWMVSLRYLKPRGKEGFISIIAFLAFMAVMIGVAALIIVMAVMNGFRSELQDKILGLNGHLVVQSVDNDFADFLDVTQKIRAIEGTEAVLPLVEGQVMATSQYSNSGVLVRGMRKQDLLELKSVSNNIKNGSLTDFDTAGGVIVGSRLANKLGLLQGENITLISPRGPATPFGTAPLVRTYPIEAIFEIGMSDYDATFVFMPLSEAQAYFNQNGTVTALEVLVSDPNDMDNYRSKVHAAVDKQLFLTDWRQRNEVFFSALQVERNVMFIILSLIIVVAALNIISAMIMLVKDKGADIAILRTMGSTRGTIMRIFFITGATIGLVGTLAGLIFGVIFCLNIESIRQFISSLLGTNLFNPEIYYLSQLPAEMDGGEVFAVVAMSLTLTFLATLYPSWRAATLDPVEALRNE